ncbi:hypothetical protein ANN_12388 [Periplaneta americana]|uniref:Reverse transcriptase domain-containing protein n=1 Tax=Periplaneta americana TaxID=6978 RepID=A0ABQ8THF7_PERAM|nr:hypothetical protein ANN_12388 [Periplaneta americana]
MPVVLYGCETWAVTLKEKQRLRVFENKVLKKIFGAKRDEVTGEWRKLHNAELHALKIFGAKRDEVTGEWRKLHNAELHALYSSPDMIRNIKSRRLRWAGHVARMDESRNAYRVLVGRLEGKRPLGRPRRRWEDNIKMDLREVGYDGRDWINLAQDRDQWRTYVRAAMNLRPFPKGGAEIPPLNSRRHVYKQRKHLKDDVGCRCDATGLSECREFRSVNGHLVLLDSGNSVLRREVSQVSSILFNIYLENLVTNCFQNMGGVIVRGRRINYVKFADDMALLAEEETVLRDMLLELNDSCDEDHSHRKKNNKDRIINEVVLERVSEERMMLKLIRKRKRNWLGHWLRRNCLLKDALEGIVNGRRVRGRRRYQMIDDIKKCGSYAETKRKAENRKYQRKLDLQ